MNSDTQELLRNTSKAAIQGHERASVLLRQCSVLAHQLPSRELGDWVQLELGGYPDGFDRDDLPYYRRASAPAYAEWIEPGFGSRTRVRKTLPGWMAPSGGLPLVNPIGVLESILRALLDGKKEEQAVVVWPDEMKAVVEEAFGHNLDRVYSELTIPALEGLSDGIRNEVVTRLAQYQEGQDTPGPEQDSARDLNKVEISGQVLGSVVLSQGSVAPTQKVKFEYRSGVEVDTGDWGGLEEILRGLGETEERIAALQEALKADAAQGIGKFGDKVKAWLAGASASAAGQVAGQAIRSFLGD